MFSRPIAKTTKGYASRGICVKLILSIPHIVKLAMTEMAI